MSKILSYGLMGVLLPFAVYAQGNSVQGTWQVLQSQCSIDGQPDACLAQVVGVQISLNAAGNWCLRNFDTSGRQEETCYVSVEFKSPLRTVKWNVAADSVDPTKTSKLSLDYEFQAQGLQRTFSMKAELLDPNKLKVVESTVVNDGFRSQTYVNESVMIRN